MRGVLLPFFISTPNTYLIDRRFNMTIPGLKKPDHLGLTVPKWQLTCAFFGILYLIAMVASVPRIGIAVAQEKSSLRSICFLMKSIKLRTFKGTYRFCGYTALKGRGFTSKSVNKRTNWPELTKLLTIHTGN